LDNKTFEQAFNAVFHDEEVFKSFLSLRLNEEITEFTIQSRKIYRTSDKLKKYLRFIDRVVLRHLNRNEDVVHSYIKERSTLTAVQSHASNKAFFMTDIKDFFNNIKTQDILTIFNRDKKLIPFSDFEDYIPLIVKMTTWGDSIPIGFPTSPQFSNAFLLGFDNALQQYCNEKGLVYSRYSDDIIISGKKTSAFDTLEDNIQIMLQQNTSEKFLLNLKKTRITHIGNKVKILGLIITPNGQVTIDSKYKKILESLLHFYSNNDRRYEELLTREFDGKERSLFGMLHYAKSIDSGYLEKLQRKYGAYTLSSLMEDKWSGR